MPGTEYVKSAFRRGTLHCGPVLQLRAAIAYDNAKIAEQSRGPLLEALL